jgi:hypothetical protein
MVMPASTSLPPASLAFRHIHTHVQHSLTNFAHFLCYEKSTKLLPNCRILYLSFLGTVCRRFLEPTICIQPRAFKSQDVRALRHASM